MEIKLLEKGYKTDENVYQLFLNNQLWDSDFISKETVWIPNELPEFPIFFAIKDKEERKRQFIEAIKNIEKSVISLDRDIFMDECFWHSWLCLYRREYLLKTYPQIISGYEKFKNIVLKDFDWENYIYKAILIAQYVSDHKEPEEFDHMYDVIMENMDMFNYIIKYEIFRNSNFLINIMEIIDETGLSKVLKAKIRNRSDLGKDERYGRRVIFEFNKSYPVVLGPMLDKNSMKDYFLKYLSYYYKETDLIGYDDIDEEESYLN